MGSSTFLVILVHSPNIDLKNKLGLGRLLQSKSTCSQKNMVQLSHRIGLPLRRRSCARQVVEWFGNWEWIQNKGSFICEYYVCLHVMWINPKQTPLFLSILTAYMLFKRKHRQYTGPQLDGKQMHSFQRRGTKGRYMMLQKHYSFMETQKPKVDSITPSVPLLVSQPVV